MEERSITKWFGGLADDSREQVYTEYNLCRHFDTISSPNVLLPYRDYENQTATDFFIGNFVFSGGILYGLGRNTADTKTKLFYLNGSLPDGTWTAATTGEATNVGANTYEMFGDYKAFLYGIRASSSLWRYEIATNTFSEAFGALSATVTTAAPPIVAADDDFYIPYNNRLASVDSSGTFTATAFLLPDDLVITSLANYGDFLAIATRPKNFRGSQSKVFLWNLIDADPTQIIIWGDENLQVIETIDNQIVGASISNNTSLFIEQVLFGKTWSGGDVTTFKEIKLDSTGYAMSVIKQFINNRLYFIVNAGGSGLYNAVWNIGRKDERYPWQIVPDRQLSNAGVNDSPNAFYIVGDYVWIATITADVIIRTNDDSTPTFTITSFVNTQRYNGDNPAKRWQLVGISASFTPLTGTGGIVVKYRKDEETNFTTLFTASTANLMYYALTRSAFPAGSIPKFNEIQFRIESTGNNKPTSLWFEYEEIETAAT